MIRFHSSIAFGIKHKGIKISLFSENIREYPCFKNNFIKQIFPPVKNTGFVGYKLKSCLQGIPYDILRNVDGNLTGRKESPFTSKRK